MLVKVKLNTKDLLTNKLVNFDEDYLVISSDKDFSFLINQNGIIKVKNTDIIEK